MLHPISRRQALVALFAAVAAPAVVGCGGSDNNVSVLSDQGQINRSVRKSGDRKPQKGMDRDGS